MRSRKWFSTAFVLGPKTQLAAYRLNTREQSEWTVRRANKFKSIRKELLSWWAYLEVLWVLHIFATSDVEYKNDSTICKLKNRLESGNVIKYSTARSTIFAAQILQSLLCLLCLRLSKSYWR